MMLQLPVSFGSLQNSLELYEQYWLPFAQLLVNMERKGIKVDSLLIQ